MHSIVSLTSVTFSKDAILVKPDGVEQVCDLVFFLQALSQKYTMYQQYVSLEILLQFVKT